MQCSKPEVVTIHLTSNPFPCDPNVQRNVHVKTQLGAPGVSPEIVVLCQNDTVTWDKDPGTHVDHLTVTFNKSGTPFNDSSYNDKPTFSDTDSSGKAGDAGLKDKQTYAYYPYKIDVQEDDASHTHHGYDPGVIIVK
jgi:hypothetical protein